MRYSLKRYDDDWQDELEVRTDGEDGLTKRSPDEDELRDALDEEASHELSRSRSAHRPSLFDSQIGVVALAAGVVWDELRPTFGATMARHVQLERVTADRYVATDLSEIEDGTVLFRVEIEATYPQYRRAQVAIPVTISGGRPRRGLFFVDSAGVRRALSKEAVERFMGVKEWFQLSRPADVELALTDRVVRTDFPGYGRPRFHNDLGLT